MGNVIRINSDYVRVNCASPFLVNGCDISFAFFFWKMVLNDIKQTNLMSKRRTFIHIRLWQVDANMLVLKVIEHVI